MLIFYFFPAKHMKATIASNTAPHTPITIPMICPSDKVPLTALLVLLVTVGVAGAAKPALVNELEAAFVVATKLVKSAEVTDLK